MSTAKQTSKNCNRIRFNDEQIKFLETMFVTESRPELHTKQQLAKKLGLQPRQIAIWFQNKRARSKSRQLERDYCLLKEDYDNLSLKFETLKKENQALLIQLQTLKKMDDKTDGEELENMDHFTIESSENQRFLLEGSFMSPENERGFESCKFFDNTDTNSQWWNL